MLVDSIRIASSIVNGSRGIEDKGYYMIGIGGLESSLKFREFGRGSDLWRWILVFRPFQRSFDGAGNESEQNPARACTHATTSAGPMGNSAHSGRLVSFAYDC